MKKMLSIVLAVVLIIPIVACENSEPINTPTASTVAKKTTYDKATKFNDIIGTWRLLHVVGENAAITAYNRVVFYENQTYKIGREIYDTGSAIGEETAATGNYELIGFDKQSLEKWGLTEYANSADWDYKLQNSTGMIFLDGLGAVFLYTLDDDHYFRDGCRGYITLEFFSLRRPNKNR